ncbi:MULTISPECIES: 3-hydroxybutyryl-CoA dehydrogenase [unclassified Streptomyces]|uniref:3-hydroxybutyryl-CoA dehydrogenase n=1 Tax=unclassified Streptomyces TaxID=2593676 RepID=UPI002DDAF29C|nr:MULTISPECIES: 3-hydroxybutyryl-CoA dehydrogenase [unclassified Streptomyces]WSA05031.1 3-hydroxybutyryl-CoA dehydrogenase [Streptomyces sp. NBC_00841]WSJ91948.1 3-hydroxybutyryl-CoA dehydrogenase [Streptomyces sp. NBC_01320]WSK01139.1 3-hydroxybutyryl-CoA dehydrogenase [Streptomyces sp. NBC_01320]
MTRTADTIQRVGIVGAGLMGAGIAEVCARAGLDVRVHESDRSTARAGRDRIARSLARAEKAGKLSAEEREQAYARIGVDTDIDQLGPCDLVVEAVSENADAKVRVFRQLDEVVTRPDALLASNTSSIPITKIAMATRRADRVIGLHFFNPVPVLRLVEVVPSLLTSQDTIARGRAFVTDTLGKTVITSQDRAGFVVNSLLVPYILAAIRMLDSGVASAEDIDSGMMLGCAHPMGPLRLADLIGLDTVKAIAEAMHAEFAEPLYSPAPLLLRMVEAGLVGKKADRGFYDYRP